MTEAIDWKRVAEIEARAAAATEGQWHYLESEVPKTIYHDADAGVVCDALGPENAAFVASARSDVPWLCECLREMAEAIRRLRTTCLCDDDVSEAFLAACRNADALVPPEKAPR